MAKLDSSQVRRLAADLKTESGRVGARGALVLRKTALGITRDAKIMAPYEFGTLRNSIGVVFEGDGRNNRMTATVSPTAHYGIYQELGTSKMAPQPYLFPAADRWEPSFISAMEQVVDL